MAHLTPEEFKAAVEIERTCGRAGFGALIAAAEQRVVNSAQRHLLVLSWPDLSPYHIEEGRSISEKYGKKYRFEVFLAAAALHADLDNQRLIEAICPRLNKELSIRYNTPAALIPGEMCRIDGKIYKCVEVLSAGFEKYTLVEVKNV